MLPVLGEKFKILHPECCDTFLEEMQALGDFDLIMNMTLCYFDMPLSVPFDLKGIQTIKVKPTVNKKL